MINDRDQMILDILKIGLKDAPPEAVKQLLDAVQLSMKTADELHAQFKAHAADVIRGMLADG
jgi:hypothetical protein